MDDGGVNPKFKRGLQAGQLPACLSVGEGHIWILGSSPPLLIVLGDSPCAETGVKCNETGESRCQVDQRATGVLFCRFGKVCQLLTHVSMCLCGEVVD